MLNIILFLWISGGFACSLPSSGPSGENTITPGPTPVPASVSETPVSLPPETGAQPPKRTIKGGRLCENYVLAKVGPLKDPKSRLIKKASFNKDAGAQTPGLEKWLDVADPEKLVTFELKNSEKTALILGSRNIQATGLASNLFYWAIAADDHLTEIRSLSRNAGLIFWDKEGLLNYYTVVFSSEFLEDKDWDNISVDLQWFKIDMNGNPQLISEETNILCK